MDHRYQLISADSHVNEPPDLWLDRLPARYRERAPHLERFEQGDAWVMEGALDPINFGSNCCAGIPAAISRSSNSIFSTPWRRTGFSSGKSRISSSTRARIW